MKMAAGSKQKQRREEETSKLARGPQIDRERWVMPPLIERERDLLSSYSPHPQSLPSRARWDPLGGKERERSRKGVSTIRKDLLPLILICPRRHAANWEDNFLSQD